MISNSFAYHQGTVKQLLPFSENEGQPHHLSINRHHLVVTGDVGVVKCYDLSRRFTLTHTHTHAHTRTHTHTHTYTRIHTHTHTHTHAYTRTHAHIHMHTHAYTHANTHA